MTEESFKAEERMGRVKREEKMMTQRRGQSKGKASEAGREKGAGEGRGTRQDPASRQNGALGVAVRDLPAFGVWAGLGWAGALTHHETPPASPSLCRKQ